MKSIPKVFVCTVTNLWAGKYWTEGQFTAPIDPSKEMPPESYFEEITDPSDIKSIRDQYDKEDDAETFSALTDVMVAQRRTKVGMMAEITEPEEVESLETMPLKNLQEYAKSMGIQNVGNMSRETIINKLNKS
jgi:hypothetical protein